MLAAKDMGKSAYAEADRLLEEILKKMVPGDIVELGDGAVASLVDNFAVKNKSWKPCGINRFEVKVSRGTFVPKVEKTLLAGNVPKLAAALATIAGHEQDASKHKNKKAKTKRVG